MLAQTESGAALVSQITLSAESERILKVLKVARGANKLRIVMRWSGIAGLRLFTSECHHLYVGALWSAPSVGHGGDVELLT